MKYRARTHGFTLLELVLATVLLVSFILPIMLVISQAELSSVRYSQARVVRALAQQKLHDRIHYYEEEDSGTFEDEGHANWTWEIQVQSISGGGSMLASTSLDSGMEPTLLKYTIEVTVPFRTSPITHEISTFPDERWYEEMQYLMDTEQWDAVDAMQGLAPPENY